MRRLSLLVPAVVAAALLTGTGQTSAPVAADVGAQAKPNIVLILLDDARRDDLSTMPDVTARIGDQGVTFTHFYSSFPLCCPARATLLSGQYPHNHGVLNNVPPTGGWPEFEDGSTLATWLDPTYRTGLIGKYFNAYQAPYLPPGWDEWAVPRGVFNYFGSRWVQTTGTQVTNVAYPGYQTATLGDLSVDFIQRNAPSTEPFFMYTSIVAPHGGNPAEADDPAPYPTPAVENRYRNVFAGLANNNPSFNEADVSDKPNQPKLLTPTQVAKITEVNAQRREAELSAQDQINRILDALEASGEMADTYVMFMSDNGYMLGEHRTKIGKIAPYQPSNRVPFMVRGPGIPAGGMVDDETAQVDFAPTVLAMAGATADDPASIDGLSLLPQLTNPTVPLARPAILLEATQTASALDPLPWQYHGIVSDQWKYIERQSGARELYDLDADPDELENVAGKPAHVDVQAQLAALLDRYRWCVGAECH